MQFHVAVAHDTNAALAARAVSRAVREAFGRHDVDLACLFFSPHYAQSAPELARAVARHLAPRVMVGCMGRGIIGPSEEYETQPAVTLWAAQWPGVRMTPFRLTFHEQDNAAPLVEGWPEALHAPLERPTLLVFADPFSTPIKDVFRIIERRCPGAPAIGGLASGGDDLGDQRLVFDGEIVEEGLIGVALRGPVSIRTLVSQGCRPIGERFVVTRAERNVIYELGGVPALEILHEAYRTAESQERERKAAPGSLAVQVGVAFDEQCERFDHGDFLIRGVVGVDKRSGCVATTDVVGEGQTVQFHLRDQKAASDDFHLLLARDRQLHRDAPGKGALLFSCNGRGRRFFPKPHHDITALQGQGRGIPAAGFFAAGEIVPVGGTNFIHVHTASVALFAEATPEESSPE